jgi:hypothetical protein
MRVSNHLERRMVTTTWKSGVVPCGANRCVGGKRAVGVVLSRGREGDLCPTFCATNLFCEFSNVSPLRGVDLSVCFGHTQLRGWGGWLALAWLAAAFAPPRMLLTLFHLSFPRTSLACARWVRVWVWWWFWHHSKPVRCWVCPNEVGCGRTGKDNTGTARAQAPSQPIGLHTHSPFRSSLTISLVGCTLAGCSHGGGVPRRQVRGWR